ncbi:HEPN domain-containing protein [Methanoculleus sp.]|uniref:HEPN domain-containing protein n=1 Tax=Methanoculleus sp. TaxID=90427 RepID=UPI002FCA37F8
MQIVTPSAQVQEAYRKKSESYLVSAKILLENERLEETVSMAYYSMYYMVLALLFATGIKCENHSGATILLESLYGIDNSRIAAAKRDRIDKQYYVNYPPLTQGASRLSSPSLLGAGPQALRRVPRL